MQRDASLRGTGTGVQALASSLARYAAATLDGTLAELGALAAIDAPTGDADALRATEEALGSTLEELGARVRRHPTPIGTHLEARLGPENGEPVLVVAHYDTVWPRGTAAARPFHIERGVAHGPGVHDMRGGLAATLAAVRGLQELGELRRPVILLLTADEEAGSTTSAELIVELGREACGALVPEACLPGGALKTSRKGVATYRFEIEGQEAHAGLTTGHGVSAVRELVALVGQLEQLARPGDGTTINVGVVGGGSRPNVIPGSAFAEVDVRVTTVAEDERIHLELGRLGVGAGATLAVRRLHDRPPMERTPAIGAAAGRAAEIAGLLGIVLGEGSAGGASDANFLAPLGIPVLDGLGPEGGGAHAPDEHVLVASVEQRVALIALLIALL
jgi:glutamate carboxypeptidase